MANNSKNDDFPTIRLDEEDRRDYQAKKQAAPSKAPAQSSLSSTSSASQAPSSGNGIWITFVAMIALVACGGCYYLYTLLEQQKAVALALQEIRSNGVVTTTATTLGVLSRHPVKVAAIKPHIIGLGE